MNVVMYDWLCAKCDLVFETLGSPKQKHKNCPRCPGKAKKIISTRGSLNETPAWINESLKVIDKDDPLARRLVFERSRSALKKYMKNKGLRLMDDGERTITKEDRERADDRDHERRTRYAVEKHIERNRIKVRSGKND